MLNPSAALHQLAAGIVFTALASACSAYRFLEDERERERTEEERLRKFVSDEAQEPRKQQQAVSVSTEVGSAGESPKLELCDISEPLYSLDS